MAENKCEKSESGKHEADYERLKLHGFRNFEAVLKTNCLHCGTGVEFTLHDDEGKWEGLDDYLRMALTWRKEHPTK